MRRVDSVFRAISTARVSCLQTLEAVTNLLDEACDQEEYRRAGLPGFRLQASSMVLKFSEYVLICRRV